MKRQSITGQLRQDSLNRTAMTGKPGKTVQCNRERSASSDIILQKREKFAGMIFGQYGG
jgi:hypothetical protein